MLGISGLTISLSGVFIALLFLTQCTQTNVPKGAHLPPGPRRWPIIGSALDMPRDYAWIGFTRLAKKYGDLVFLKVLGISVVCVNSVAVAHDLFDTRSSLYSDRYDLPMMKLIGVEWFFGQMRYGDVWRWHRKAFYQHFNANAVLNYRDIEITNAHILLRNLKETPLDFAQHIRHFAGAIIMEIAYGIKVLPKDDPYIDIAEKAMRAASIVGNFGTYLVDLFPWLKYVPEWVPGASFRKQARLWREIVMRMPQMPYDTVKQAIDSGTAVPSVTVSLIEEYNGQQKDAPIDIDEGIRNTAAAAYAAGADTTLSALICFVLAMVRYPEVQKKAQAEIDKIVIDRLPDFSDRERLPYIDAICKEALRWHPVGPLGVAHALTHDDVYNNNFMPAGSIVIANAWAMLHDVNTFGPNPADFVPERFFEPGVPDPTIAFGFGRRVCPGRFLAEDTVFITIVSILKAYNISLPVDSQGNALPVPEARFTSGFMSHPVPFKCTIKPRSKVTERLISESARE